MTAQENKELELIVNKIGDTINAEEIYLFGSFAERTQKDDSDYDLYVILSENEIRPLKAIQKINIALAELDIRPVDILANYKKTFTESAKGFALERTILEKGVKVYEDHRYIG